MWHLEIEWLSLLCDWVLVFGKSSFLKFELFIEVLNNSTCSFRWQIVLVSMVVAYYLFSIGVS